MNPLQDNSDVERMIYESDMVYRQEIEDRNQYEMNASDNNKPAIIPDINPIGIMRKNILNRTLSKNVIDSFRNELFPWKDKSDGEKYQVVNDQTFKYDVMADLLLNFLNIKVFYYKHKPTLPAVAMIERDGRYYPMENEIGQHITYIAGTIVKKTSWKLVYNAIVSNRDIYHAFEDIETHDKTSNFINGVVDISGGEVVLREMNDDEIYFKHVPNQYVEGAECPMFKEFLGEVLDEKYHKLIFEWIGYGFFETYNIQKIMFHCGIGGAGKSVLLGVISAALGIHNRTGLSLKDCAKESYRLAELVYAMANHGSEVGYKDLKMGMDILKRLSSGTDPIMVEQKYMTPYPIINTAKMTFLMNALPKLYDSDTGFDRRLLLVRWEKALPRDRASYFLNDVDGINTPSEISGVIYESIKAYKEMVNNGGEFDYKLPDDPTNSYDRESDPIGAFIYDCVDVLDKHDPEYHSPGLLLNTEIYNVYVEWARKYDINPLKKPQFLTRHAFPEQLVKMGAIKQRNNSGRGWENVVMYDVEDTTEQTYL